MVRREDYVDRTIIQRRELWLHVQAEARQSNAEQEGRTYGARGGPATRAGALHTNFLGLCGECVNRLYVDKVAPDTKWHYFKTGDLTGLPDLDIFSAFTKLDAKTNEREYPTNFLIIQPNDPPDWIYTLNFPLTHPTYRTTGWCFGHEALALSRHEYFYPLGRGRPPAFNVPHNHEIMHPMHELLRLLRLRQRYGYARGTEEWARAIRA